MVSPVQVNKLLLYDQQKLNNKKAGSEDNTSARFSFFIPCEFFILLLSTPCHQQQKRQSSENYEAL